MQTNVPFAWSYSALKNYETCPKRYYHLNVAKDIKEPQTQQLLDGNNLHHAFDRYLMVSEKLPIEFMMHKPLLDKIKKAPGNLVAEQRLALTNTFQPAAYFAPNVWLRVVIDCVVTDEERTKATIFDWKTGKPSEDLTQMQLCAATMFAFLPTVVRIKVALVFVAHNKVEPAEFVRDDLAEIWGEILPRVKAVQRARDTQEYPPTPSGLCKRYCPVVSCPYHGKGA
jgi:CRISPR/Cas system-associated exonuclease Cas4 (RecB family)